MKKAICSIIMVLACSSMAMAGSATYSCKINKVIYNTDLTNTVTATCTLIDLFGNSDILDIESICAMSKEGEIRCGKGDNSWRLEKNEYVKFTHRFGKTKSVITKVYVND